MLKRTISAVVIIGLFVAMLLLGGIYLQVGFAIVGLLCEYEMISSIKKKGVVTIDIPVYILTLALLPTYRLYGLKGVAYTYCLAVMAIFMFRILSEKYDYDSVLHSLLAIIYPQIFMLFLYMVITMKDEGLGIFIIVISVIAASASDTMAYFTGMLMGKHKLCPKISPNKTVEGAIGGLVGGTVLTGVAALFLERAEMPIYMFFLLGFLLALLSQFGDLTSSVTKRYLGVKDFGDLIPGHGGMLDRVCSIIFVIPVALAVFEMYYGALV